MKIEATDDHDSSPFNRLPDEIVFEILNRITDLKTLCFCKLVTKRFSSIVLQVDTISFTTSSPKPPFDFVTCLKKFKRVKYLCVKLSSIPDDDYFLLKWKTNFTNGVLSYIFMSPNVIYDTDENDHEEEEDDIDELELKLKKLDLGLDCWMDLFKRFIILLHHIIMNIPSLEKVSIMDSSKRGRISPFNSGGKVFEVRHLLPSLFGAPNQKRNSWSNTRLLKMPVSGFTMKGATLMLFERGNIPNENDDFINIEYKDDDDDVEDMEKGAYCEDVKEIINKHRDLIYFRFTL